MLFGNRIKKYLIVTCPYCHESFRIDYKDIMKEVKNTGKKIVWCQCPWCEENTIVEPYNNEFNKDNFMYVREN